jgi:HK97 gp10 family phage protein
MPITFKITGLAELEAKLEKLPPRAARKIIKTDLLEIGKIWQEAIIARARRGLHHWAATAARAARASGTTDSSGRRLRALKARAARPARTGFGFLASNIVVAIRTKNDLEATLKVGPSSAAFWGKFLEFGTGPRTRSDETGGHNLRGTARKLFQKWNGGNKMPAFPFVRPAFDETEGEIMEVLRQRVRDSLIESGLPLK